MMIIIFGEQPPVYSVAQPAAQPTNPGAGYSATPGNFKSFKKSIKDMCLN